MTAHAISQALLAALGLAAASSTAAADPGLGTIHFLEQRVANDPSDTVAQNQLAALSIQRMRDTGDLGWLERALQSAQASLATLPGEQNPGGVAVMAVAEFESHHFREALALAQQVCANDPGNVGALCTAADAQLELGNYTEAEALCQQLKATESAPAIQARLARLAELTGRNQEAIALLGQAAANAPETAWYRVRLGELYFRTGDLEKAGGQYEAARQLQPEGYLVLDHLAELRAAEGKYDEAVALYKRVVARSPRGEAFQALGDLYLFINQPTEAKVWHERARQAYLESVKKGNAHYYHHLAGFYADAQEDADQALRWALKDLDVRHSVYAYDALAWALYKQGQFRSAVENATRALALGTKDAHLLFHAAMIYSRADQLERGTALLKEALAVNPRYNSFHAHR
jgi:tetratricopeptide (TPR) repeat protein